MPRNLDRRVEALVPVEEPALQERLEEVLAINLADDTLAWTLASDGTWTHLDGGTVNTHQRLEQIAAGRVRQPS
jgi:polyphosphate kinase